MDQPTFLSEVFPLTFHNNKFVCFNLSPQIDRKLGNRFSWRFSQKFTDVIVVWHKGYFFALTKPNQSLPSHNEWKDKLLEIEADLLEDIGNVSYSIKWEENFQLSAQAKAQLAVRILKIIKPFTATVAFNESKVKIQREAKIAAETIEIDQVEEPALTITVESKILYSEDLEELYNSYQSSQEAEKVLVGLKVRDLEKGSFGTIVSLAGNIGDRREELLSKSTGAISRAKLKSAPDNQPLVSVKFGKNTSIYDYPLGALRPCITSETADKFGLEYGELIKNTKVGYPERQKLLKEYRIITSKTLNEYEFHLKERCVNSQEYKELFWTPEIKLEDTEILFGKNFVGKKSKILPGLRKGGVYGRHPEFSNPQIKIRLAIFKLVPNQVGSFRKQLQSHLKSYGFESILAEENCEKLNVEGLPRVEARAEVEKLLNKLMDVPADIFLVFLPQSDRHADYQEGGSLYDFIYSRLLCRNIASQFIYEKTLEKKPRDILNQVVPGILAKLGNLPYVLEKPLDSADYFLGLDVSRMAKKNKPGSINACASVHLHDQKGAFIKYQLADGLIEGEEIPQRTLENLLPQATLLGKKVLIYRDGSFQGNEVKNLLSRAKVIKAKLILVECYKSGNPRLYNLSKGQISPPPKGLALRLSSREVIIVTTQVSQSVGVPNPLRLKVHEAGESIPISSLVNTTLKLTLLHYGSLKETRLPVPLFGSDRIAYLRLKGIYSGSLEGDKQYWL